MSKDDNRFPSALVAVGTKALAVSSAALVKRGLALAETVTQGESGLSAKPEESKLSPEAWKRVLDWAEHELPTVERCNAAYLLLHRRDWAGALAEYREALHLSPNLAEPHCGLGNALYQKGELESAIAEYREALRLDPDYGAAHFNLALALGDKGDWHGAIAEYGEALRWDADFGGTSRHNLSAAHNSLGRALGRKGDWNGAITEYREALRLNPANGYARINLRVALKHEGDWDAMMAEEREALRLFAENASAHYRLGYALEHKHNLREALQEYRTAYELNPQNPTYRRAYERLLNSEKSQNLSPEEERQEFLKLYDEMYPEQVANKKEEKG